MKLPRLRTKNTYTPFMLTASWYHGAIVGLFIGMMLGAWKWDRKPQDGWAILAMLVLIALLIGLELLHKWRITKLTVMQDEAAYMNELHDGGIDVSSPGFDVVLTDREYHQ